MKPRTVFEQHAIDMVWQCGAVLSGKVVLQGTSAGKAFRVNVRFDDVRRKSQGRWQVIFTEVTRFPVPS